MPALARSLERPSKSVLWRVLDVLIAYGEPACAAGVPALLKVISGPDDEFARIVAGSISKLKCNPDLVVPLVAKGLENPRVSVRKATLIALVMYGESARHALPALRKSLNDPDAVVRGQARNIIGKIAPEALGNTPPR